MSKENKDTSKENAFAFLEWFYLNADFGPADADVKWLMRQQYEDETGNSVPEEYTE